jgi:putative sugar O-methyltransferase
MSVMIKKEPDFNLLDKMYKDHLAGPDVYHASKFWEKLNQINIDWLKKDGLNNFKRTVNNNYFNWMVTTKSDYYKNVSRFYFRNIIRNPLRISSLLTTSIGEMYHRTYVSTNTQVSYFQRKVYAFYLVFLYAYVKAHDKFGIFEKLDEPLIGNPIFIEKNNKRISQDISNSYMEYQYIRTTLGTNFEKVRVVAEIGGGYGRLSYLFHLLHKNDGVKIVLIDLPPALFVAQWYLKNAFPEAKVMDYQNFSDFSEVKETFEKSSICFLLPHQIELLPEGTLDLLINVSSLQEMSRKQINHYYELVDKVCRYFYTKQWIMWENSEDKLTVPAIVYPTKPDWEIVGARINPIHTSFFEAMFKVD